MEYTAWNTLLFVLKWVFIALIYFSLGVILLAVRRELLQRVQSRQAETAIAAGRLRVVNPGSDPRIAPGSVFNLKPVTSLGSARENDIVLSDSFISRHHALLRWDGVGWWMEDLGSRNGTFINKTRLKPNSPEAVPEGTVVYLGEMAFELME